MSMISHVKNNDATMHTGLPSAKELAKYDSCYGIHGAARLRKGVKKATSAARRRNDKDIIEDELYENDCED